MPDERAVGDLSVEELREWLADLFVFDSLTGDPGDPRDVGNDVWLDYCGWMNTEYPPNGWQPGWLCPKDIEDELLEAYAAAVTP